MKEGICHIVSVAQVSHLETLERALMLLDRKEVSQYLCRVLVVCKTVDYRDLAVFSKVFNVLVLECSDHDAVDHAGQYVSRVVDGLASADLDVIVAQEKSHAAQLVHSDFKGDSRSCGRLCEDHGKCLSLKKVVLDA